ncbi:MAG: ABC transporter permease subunit [Verrucomicrobia bacterium]|nr:ABC transporter permease subunit [Verrucomicrobiota bacterium]
MPMLTMRSVAEERRLGTLETMMTTPIGALELVAAKFAAAYSFYILIWASSMAYPLLTSWGLGQPAMTQLLLDPGTIKGGYAFIALSGMLFIAVGVFSSSLTRSQLVAGMLSFSILFMLMVGATALNFVETGLGHNQFRGAPLVQYLQVFQHFEDFVRGTIDTRPLVYYLSGTALVLGLAGYNVESKA